MIDFAKLRERANTDSEFKLAARYWVGHLEFGIDSDRVELSIHNGEVSAWGEPETLENDAQPIRIAASEADWRRLLSPIPPPGWHDVRTARGFTVNGDILDLGPYYMAIRRLIELMREQVGVGADVRQIEDVERRHDDAIGRYVYIRVDGQQYRIYYEEAGSGIPLLMQHTAGADGRQWRHLLEDRAYQSEFRMISYDLPYHGKSIPPTSKRWWECEYRLTKAFLMDVVVTLAQTLDLERSVFMGCSIGGLLAPDLAFYHPDQFRSVIGVNAALALPTRSDAETNERLNSWYHPRVSDEWKAASMLGVMSPTSPEAYRRETAWVYSQGAPPVFKGDIFYYSVDHDLTAEQARQIDTSRVGVYLLTGEYGGCPVDCGFSVTIPL